jgi:hypothetical protein
MYFVSLGTEFVAVSAPMYWVECSIYLSFFPSFFALHIFLVWIELCVSLNILIFPTRLHSFERMDVFVFFSLTLGQVSYPATQLLPIITAIFLSFLGMPSLYPSPDIIFK